MIVLEKKIVRKFLANITLIFMTVSVQIIPGFVISKHRLITEFNIAEAFENTLKITLYFQ